MGCWKLAFVSISGIWSYLYIVHFIPAYMMIGMESTAVHHAFQSILMTLRNKTDVGGGVGNGTQNYNNKMKRNSGYNMF